MIRWAEWSAEAFARARAEGKPVLLSLTATWCHACHRMDDETWSDPGVAAAVERVVVPVRVDADARPDVYGRFHLGGLPSTALLTAEAEFVRGGTFLSPLQCLGFLDAAVADWRAGRRPAARVEAGRRVGVTLRPEATVRSEAARHPGSGAPAESGTCAEAAANTEGDVRGKAAESAESAASESPAARLVDQVVERLRRRADLVHGGFGVAPKLPEPDAVTLLLRRGAATGDHALTRIARLTLDAIAAHLVDPDDGGFFRYGAGADWSGPHTEKLAVDQAALIRLYLEAAVVFGEPRYAEVARGAVDHARRRLVDARGRVLASVAAAPALDEQGEPRVDARRFADAAAAMISAACAARAAGIELMVDRELLSSAPDGEVPHELGGPSAGAGGVSGLLDDQAIAIAAAVDDFRAAGERRALEFALRVADWSLGHLFDATASVFTAGPASRPGDPALPAMVPLIANGRMALALVDLGDTASRPGLARLARQVVDSLAARAARSPAGSPLALAAVALAS